MRDPDSEVTDNAVADLRFLVNRKCIAAADKPDRVPGLISAMRSDAGIEDAVQAGFHLNELQNVIARIIGPDHPHLSLLTDLTPAIALLRASFTPETLDAQAMADEIISLIQSVANHSSP